MNKVILKQQPITIQTNFQGLDCLYRAIENEEQYDIEWGTLFLYDKNINKYNTLYSTFHVWNKDKQTIYDDLSGLENGAKLNGFEIKPVSEWKGIEMNGSKFSGKNQIAVNDLCDVEDYLNKTLKIKWDFVYVSGVACLDNYTKMDDNILDEMIENITQNAH
jgi:hypothetical protein